MSATVVPFRKALTTASGATAFTEKEPTATKPTNDGFWDLLSDTVAVHTGAKSTSYVSLIPYAIGVGTNDTFDFRLWGWSETQDATKLYIPQLLLAASVTLGTTTGNDGTAIGAGVLMAKAITVNIGAGDGAFRSVISTGLDGATSSILVHVRGCRFIEFDFDTTDGDITAGMNVYWRPVD